MSDSGKTTERVLDREFIAIDQGGCRHRIQAWQTRLFIDGVYAATTGERYMTEDGHILNQTIPGKLRFETGPFRGIEVTISN